MDDLTRLILALLVIAALALIAVLAPLGSPGNAATVTPGPPGPPGHPGPPGACTERVADGGFETGGAWQFGASPVPPQVVTYSVHSGAHALQMGITSGANVESFSSARQTVSIPPGADRATLSFWFYAIAEAPATTDYMELVIFDADGSAILGKPWRSHNDSRMWNQASFDLSAWRGQTIRLYFNVYNDGVSGRAAMFLDDVSLSACPAPVTKTVAPPHTAIPGCTPCWPAPACTPGCPPWPPTATPGCVPCGPTPACTPGCPPWPPPATATRTPAATPSVSPTVATGCQELTQNGGFEAGLAGWVPGVSALPPRLVTNPALGGSHSLQLGSQLENRSAYSSIRQTVFVPPGYARAIVSFWAYTWAESTAGSDVQQFVVLGPKDAVWAVPWKVLEDARTWERHTFDLSDMIGETFDLYFAAVNDGKGGRTVLLLDEVHLWGCAGDAQPSIVSPLLDTGGAPLDLPAAVSTQPSGAAGVLLVGTPAEEGAPAGALSGAEPVSGETPVSGEELVSGETPVSGETLSPAEIAPIQTLSPAEARTLYETPLPPGPRWTEVAIDGSASAGTAAPAGAAVAPNAVGAGTTPLPAGAVLSSTPQPGVSVAPEVTPAPTPGFLQRMTANWPRQWPWVVGAVLVLALIVMWLVQRGARAY